MRILLLALLLACGSSSSPPTETKAATSASPPASGHGAGRDRWRGGGVYVDGQPIGVLRYGELPVGLEPVWETQRHRLPFRAGEEIRYRETRVPRYRVTDYLRSLGVKLDEIVEVHIHGGRDSAIVLTHDDLRDHPDGVLFKFASDNSGKPIPIIRGISVGTRFDDLAALTVYVKREPPRLTKQHTLVLDGIPVRGIPYRGEPLREGVRVYVDNRLATVLKRNELATSGQVRWSLTDVLERQGVATKNLARLELIYEEVRTSRLPWDKLEFTFNPGASGEIRLGDRALPANSIALFTDGRPSAARI